MKGSKDEGLQVDGPLTDPNTLQPISPTKEDHPQEKTFELKQPVDDGRGDSSEDKKKGQEVDKKREQDEDEDSEYEEDYQDDGFRNGRGKHNKPTEGVKDKPKPPK